MNTPSPQDMLANLQSRLDAHRQQGLGSADFAQQARSSSALLAALPPAFGDVLGQLLDRMESSALFSEESCSFSQSGLLDSLQLWIDKARERLAR